MHRFHINKHFRSNSYGYPLDFFISSVNPNKYLQSGCTALIINLQDIQIEFEFLNILEQYTFSKWTRPRVKHSSKIIIAKSTSLKRFLEDPTKIGSRIPICSICSLGVPMALKNIHSKKIKSSKKLVRPISTWLAKTLGQVKQRKTTWTIMRIAFKLTSMYWTKFRTISLNVCHRALKFRRIHHKNVWKWELRSMVF